MRIVILADFDFAGNMYNLAQNINRLTEHNATAIKLRINPRLRYPTMMKVTEENKSEVKKLCLDADAIIFKEVSILMKRFGLKPKEIRNKKIVALFGGGGWSRPRLRKANIPIYKQLNATFASTRLDFIEKSPQMVWLPASIRMNDLRKKYNYSKLEPPLFATSPSNATDKTRYISEHFKQIVAHLKKKGVHFQHHLIKNMENDSCLKLKAHASVFFDRIAPIYGINSQEAAAFESAVVVGYNDFVDKKLNEYGFNSPFINVKTPEKAAEAVEALLTDEKYRKNKAQECYEFVGEVHDGRECVKRLMKVLNN